MNLLHDVPQLELGQNNVKASSLLRQIGVPDTYIGFCYLAYAVALVLTDQSYLYQLFKRLYPDIAKKFHTSAACVERDLRTVIRVFWAADGQLALQAVVPRPPLRRPTAGELIALLSGYFQDRCDL